MKHALVVVAVLMVAAGGVAAEEKKPAAPAAPAAKEAAKPATPAAPAGKDAAKPAGGEAAMRPATPPAPPAPPPELQKTVDAFVGNWNGDVTLTLPGAQPVKTKVKIVCKKIAGGKAVGCAMTGKMPGMGPFETNVMVGYDTWSKSVHFMAMTSDEEVHDHRCQWKDDKNLVCDTLKSGMMGQPITEELSFVAEGKTMTFKSTVKMADGGVATFEAALKK